MSDDKPWMDYDRLLELEQEKDTDRAIADELGCHPNTVRKHLERAHEEQERRLREQERREADVESTLICVRCEENETPGGEASANRICDQCLDEVRHDE